MFNTGKFAGRTIFITGASRGIGKEIALKLAQDGANIVIAAKTTTAHPKLPGTIYSAAEEIVKAGGKALPCIVDVRDEESITNAVEQTVKTFGGIDILINNASAINISNTTSTDMKRYDLMHSVNTRGTYLMTKTCLPYLKKGKNPHVLNISPPLVLESRWFSGHLAYTMAKYGMSMCVLGHHEEFRPFGIAVNALWPVTAIWTAAAEMLSKSYGGAEGCRKPAIMADAAYAVLSKNSREFTGQFAIDEDILRAEGVTDFDKYALNPGTPLSPDIFLPSGTYDHIFDGTGEMSNLTEARKKSRTVIDEAVLAQDITNVIERMNLLLSSEIVSQFKTIYQFKLNGSATGQKRSIVLDLKNGSGVVEERPCEDPDVKFTLASSDFPLLFNGTLLPTTAFMTKRLTIAGDINRALKLSNLLKKLNKV